MAESSPKPGTTAGTVCCDLHGVHCEPPGELCCRACTEGEHPEHPAGALCVLVARETELWQVLDWSLWGNGLGDRLREAIADTALASLTGKQRAMAEECIKAWHERRGPSVAVGEGTALQKELARQRNLAVTTLDRGISATVLRAALSGRVPVTLPAPDGDDEDSPYWETVEGRVRAEAGRVIVETGRSMAADYAEENSSVIWAAAREARHLAVEGGER